MALRLIGSSNLSGLQGDRNEGLRGWENWLSVDLEEMIIIGNVEFEVLDASQSGRAKTQTLFVHTILTASCP